MDSSSKKSTFEDESLMRSISMLGEYLALHRKLYFIYNIVVYHG